jgi:molybdenum cofactor cytidylyltransferase
MLASMQKNFSSVKVAAVVLAGGRSSRMGRPKQLLEFRGETLLKRAALSALKAGCRPVVVVTGANANASRQALSGLDVIEAPNEQWESGISSSVRAGVEAAMTAAPEADAVVLMLCDQPLVTPEIIAGLIHAHLETGREIIASSYGESYGAPALFHRKHFAELMTLSGDAGAKSIIQKHFAAVQLIPFADGTIDIDTPEDFARLS